MIAVAVARPPVPIEVRDKIWRAVQAGVAAANERRGPVTVAFDVTPPAEIDPLDIFAAASDIGERFFWEQPSRGIAAVALGAAAALEFCGESRFADAAAQTRQLFDDLVR
ncbi:MAG TPA: hypothetical protein VFX03_04795, partial [Thermomicrobiales bacterium]|nr:hypothetical protein [Thermomicrobiales bacterium]